MPGARRSILHLPNKIYDSSNKTLIIYTLHFNHYLNQAFRRLWGERRRHFQVTLSSADFSSVQTWTRFLTSCCLSCQGFRVSSDSPTPPPTPQVVVDGILELTWCFRRFQSVSLHAKPLKPINGHVFSPWWVDTFSFNQHYCFLMTYATHWNAQFQFNVIALSPHSVHLPARPSLETMQTEAHVWLLDAVVELNEIERKH